MFGNFHSLPGRVWRGSGALNPRRSRFLLALVPALLQLQAFARPEGALNVTCPADKSVACGSTWTFDPPTATGGCGSITVTDQGTSNPTATCGKTYFVTRSWLVTDGCDVFQC